VNNRDIQIMSIGLGGRQNDMMHDFYHICKRLYFVHKDKDTFSALNYQKVQPPQKLTYYVLNSLGKRFLPLQEKFI